MAAEHAGAVGPTRRMVDKAIYHLRDLSDFLRQIGHAWKGTQLDTALEILRDQIAELQAKRDALEAENARLYEGWPGVDQRASVYHTDHYRNPDMWPGGVIPADIMEVPPGWYIYRGMELDEVGPHDSRREAILAYCEINTAPAHLGHDAPAGGGE